MCLRPVLFVIGDGVLVQRLASAFAYTFSTCEILFCFCFDTGRFSLFPIPARRMAWLSTTYFDISTYRFPFLLLVDLLSFVHDSCSLPPSILFFYASNTDELASCT
jgi:hypothetical protein